MFPPLARRLGFPAVLGIGTGITLAVIVGKPVTGLATDPSSRRLVGWGKVPRGEVGLIFAMVGKQFGVMNEAMFPVIVLMVVLLTLIAPPVLTMLLERR
ncbi:MAG: cation:proton antiporter [Sulfuritalea sp.]|nr:cation:proton antiporter [Sulfuritalea sp.]